MAQDTSVVYADISSSGQRRGAAMRRAQWPHLIVVALFAVALTEVVYLQHRFVQACGPSRSQRVRMLALQQYPADRTSLGKFPFWPEPKTPVDPDSPPTRKLPKIVIDYGIDLDGDRLHNLEEYYKEGITGRGGQPTGFMNELVLRSWYGYRYPNGYIERSYEYTGEGKQPCGSDFFQAYETMKKHIRDGGPFVGKDSRNGWIWLYIDQKPDGLTMLLTKAPPLGERPIALIREDNPDEFFNNVDWHRLYTRMYKPNLWSEKTPFPFPKKAIRERS